MFLGLGLEIFGQARQVCNASLICSQEMKKSEGRRPILECGIAKK